MWTAFIALFGSLVFTGVNVLYTLHHLDKDVGVTGGDDAGEDGPS